jgi:hypothetical protein
MIGIYFIPQAVLFPIIAASWRLRLLVPKKTIFLSLARPHA